MFRGFLGWRLKQFDSLDVFTAVEKDSAIRNVESKSLLQINRDLLALRESSPENNKQLRDYLFVIRHFPLWLIKIMIVKLPNISYTLWKKYRGGAMTFTSPAKYGVDALASTWSNPLGVSMGLVKQRPMVINGEIKAVPSCHIILNFDRRVMAGAPAGRFFNRVSEILNNAEHEIGLQYP